MVVLVKREKEKEEKENKRREGQDQETRRLLLETILSWKDVLRFIATHKLVDPVGSAEQICVGDQRYKRNSNVVPFTIDTSDFYIHPMLVMQV